MPASFKNAGLYKRPPDAVSYIREGAVRGTVAFYEGWRGVRMVCRITGLDEGDAFIKVAKSPPLPLSVDQNGNVKTALFNKSMRLNNIKGLCPYIKSKDLALVCGRIK
ncbi:MAG: hypothetical protein IJC49_06230 [Clostridia bacterium]|nr:hypothetical protein [Clostridia bacterium]